MDEAGADAGGGPDVDAASDAALDAPADAGMADTEGGATPDDAGGGMVDDAMADDAMADDAMADDAMADDAALADADAAPEGGDVDAALECAVGLYIGTFEGEILVEFTFFDLELPISGEVEIFTSASGDGSNLVIENGSISGTDEDGNPIYARVSGVLNCETRQLENGRLTNGVYTREALNQTVQFEGTVEASYEPGEVPRVVGSWATEGGRESGAGTFEASLRQ